MFAALLINPLGMLLFENDGYDYDIDDNPDISFLKSIVLVTNRYVSNRFFLRGEKPRLIATTLMVVLESIKLSDIVFAVVSVPAAFVISEDMFIICTSNILAIV